jgi:transposase
MMGWDVSVYGRSPKVNATTAAIDLAKNVFQVALADANARVQEQHRLTRSQLEHFFDNRSVARVIMEACGSACRFMEASVG